MPSAFEVGYFGRPPDDDHRVGKPSIGVHLEVEQNSLDSITDVFEAPETRWVSGAQRFDLGDLAVDAEVSMDVLLTLATEFETLASMDDVQFQGVSITGEDMLRIEFVDNLQPDQPLPIGYGLFKSSELVPFLPDGVMPNPAWTPVSAPVFSNPQNPGERWFEIPRPDPGETCYFAIAAFLDNTPMVPQP